MLRNGSSYTITAEECDVHQDTVASYARKHGIRRVPPALSDATAKAIALVQAGHSFNAASRATGAALMNVIWACRRRGIQSPYLRGGQRR